MNKNYINNITSEANKALLDNIDLLNLVSRKIGCKDANEAKQITYESFLNSYPLWNQSKYELSTFICTVVKWNAIRSARQGGFNIYLPMYVHDIWTQLSRGSLDGTLEEFNKLCAKKVCPFCHLKEETYLRVVDLYYNGKLHRKITDNMLEELEAKQISKENVLSEPEVFTEDALTKINVNKFLDCLTAEQKFIIESYYGLIDNKPETLEEIGSKLNLSKERIRTRKIQALAKMHNIAKKGNKKLTSERMVAAYLNELNRKSNKKKGYLYGTN